MLDLVYDFEIIIKKYLRQVRFCFMYAILSFSVLEGGTR